MNLLDKPADWTRRPLGLSGISAVFALYMQGDSMAPWREPGSLIYVSRTRPPQIGSHVVVVTKPNRLGAASNCFVKKLIRRTDEFLHLEQYTPSATSAVPASEVSEVLRVLEWEEVIGL